MDTELLGQQASLEVRNVGGIDETAVAFDPGITILTGRNATNRTSLLRSIMAVMGSDDASLKADADEGRVDLTVGDECYVRTFTRSNGTVTTGGEPFLDDPELADLFAFLLESNEARRSVAMSEDLRELIMRPVDTDAIHAEIRELEREKSRIDDELDDLEDLKGDLPELERKRSRLEDDIEAKREELAAKEEDIEALDADVDETREEKRELESRLDDLREKRSALERVRSDIDLQQDSIESLTAERRELEAEREELPDAPMGEHAELDDEIERLRGRIDSLEREVSDLQDVIGFNEDQLDETGAITSHLDAGDDEGAVTDALVDDSVVCWTCGSTVETERITSTLDQLRSVRQEKLETTRSLESELDELKEQRRTYRKQQQRRESIDRKLDDVATELDDREEQLESLREEREDLNDDIEALEAEIETLESDDFGDVLDLHKEANQLEFELGRLESDLDDVTDRIGSIEERLTEEEQLRSQREEVDAELRNLRTRIDRIEENAVEQFNEHMAAVLDILGYDNLERIWIERVERTVREGRRNVDKTLFELHIVRSTESGATFEDTIDHLSESEREVTGLVFALAGYLVHEVYETVPFMLLDSLEAIDSERIAALIEYVADYAEFLVAALLPEDAQALDDDYTRVTEI
ncbi:archaea-specific SMC-related protein [Haloplanus rubicundus]|uniref:Chromosome segregation protein SMC n=1 Tax=Haloplanus rubicundus TaxID=1547898 RepID=A0A345EC95_9EURY|nr:archaea-specific SMC-related protein [Haloplanus rubicundus]AXG09817.1 chromosome segregation protein SMC [Haloplanus rubicundus]